jgi:hypothetical protein
MTASLSYHLKNTHMTRTQKATNWFNSRGITAREEETGIVTLYVEDYNVTISDNEVDYRAELWDEENGVANDVDGTPLKSGDIVVAIDVDDLEGKHPVRGELLKVGEVKDVASNYIEFRGNTDNDVYGFYGHRVLKIK